LETEAEETAEEIITITYSMEPEVVRIRRTSGGEIGHEEL